MSLNAGIPNYDLEISPTITEAASASIGLTDIIYEGRISFSGTRTEVGNLRYGAQIIYDPGIYSQIPSGILLIKEDEFNTPISIDNGRMKIGNKTSNLRELFPEADLHVDGTVLWGKSIEESPSSLRWTNNQNGLQIEIEGKSGYKQGVHAMVNGPGANYAFMGSADW